MGKIIKMEKSADNQYQFTLWDNGDNQFIIEIKRFYLNKKKSYDYNRYDKICFTPDNFEKFKDWVIKFKK